MSDRPMNLTGFSLRGSARKPSVGEGAVKMATTTAVLEGPDLQVDEKSVTVVKAASVMVGGH